MFKTGLPWHRWTAWGNRQLALGLPPGLEGAALRCQMITHATPPLVVVTVLGYMAVFAALGVSALVRSAWLELAVALTGAGMCRAMQQRGRAPHYLLACVVCQATLLTGIFGGQGTAIATHTYFLLFALTAPLVIPVSDRRGLALVSLECLAAYLLLEWHPVPADPQVMALAPSTLQALRLGVTVSCSAVLFATMLMSEAIQSRLEQQVRHLAQTDALTGLPNRRQFQETLQAALARASREGSPLCLAVIDIDHFKRINDQHGHASGDEVLRQLAQRLQQARRQGDLLARIGGEEFALVMSGATLPDAMNALQRLRLRLADAPVRLASQAELAVSVSIGVAAAQAGTQQDPLFAQADEALYEAKRRGRNQVVAYGTA